MRVTMLALPGKSSLERSLRLRTVYGFFLAVLIVLGGWWLVSNAAYIPAYGDSTEYLALSKSLKIDQYRTIFYPGLLRLCGIFRDGSGAPSIFWTYLVQVLAVAASSFIYATAALKVFGSDTSSTRMNFVVALLTTAVVLVNPLVAHFSLSIMSDSIATSFTVATVGALTRLMHSFREPQGRKVVWLVVSMLCLLLMALSRVDKLYLGCVVGIMAIVSLYARSPRVSRMRLGGILALLMMSIVMAIAVNRVTQITNPNRPPLDLSSMAFNRVVWPRLANVYPYLPADAREVVSFDEAKRFDTHNNNVYPLLDRLLSGHPENKRVVNEITLTTLRKFPLQVVGKTTFDVVKYALPNLAFPMELISILPESTATDWTYSRMSQPHPVTTSAVMWVSTGFFYLFQLPAAMVFLRKQRRREWIKEPFVLLTAVSIVCNALLFGLEAGMDAHIRYALPTFIMLLEVVTVLSLLWLFSGAQDSFNALSE